jgi:hypothetical protein
VRLHVQRWSVELGTNWELRSPWDDPATTEIHGVYLTHGASGCDLHLRAWQRLTLSDLENVLLQQNWGGPPTARVVRSAGMITIVGGTFPYDSRGYVREWFLSDGEHAANASLRFSADTEPAVITACEELLDTVAWEG